MRATRDSDGTARLRKVASLHSVHRLFILALAASPGCERHSVAERAMPEATPDETSPPASPRRPVRPLVVLQKFDTPAPLPGETPRQTYEAARFCVRRADYVGVWGLFCKRARGEADGALPPAIGEWRYFDHDGFVKLFGKTPSDFEKLPIAEQYALMSLRAHHAKRDVPKRFSESTFVSESIDGEKATVRYKRPDGTTTTLKLVREDGVWKLARTRL